MDLSMESLEQKILAGFDAPGARVRTLSDFGNLTAVREAASRLVERGWLRATEAPDVYARTEERESGALGDCCYRLQPPDRSVIWRVY